jgi:hypothetical protein
MPIFDLTLISLRKVRQLGAEAGPIQNLCIQNIFRQMTIRNA